MACKHIYLFQLWVPKFCFSSNSGLMLPYSKLMWVIAQNSKTNLISFPKSLHPNNSIQTYNIAIPRITNIYCFFQENGHETTKLRIKGISLEFYSLTSKRTKTTKPIATSSWSKYILARLSWTKVIPHLSASLPYLSLTHLTIYFSNTCYTILHGIGHINNYSI